MFRLQRGTQARIIHWPTYRERGAPQFFNVPGPTDHDNAFGLTDLHTNGHDATANGIPLSVGLLQHHNGSRHRQIGPMNTLRDVRSRLGKLLAFWRKQDGRYRRDGDGSRASLGGTDEAEVGDEAGARDLELEQGI